jgi:hypothetical protein
MVNKSLALAVGLFLFAIYLLSFSGKFHVMDELAVFSAGYNLAQTGRADINQLIWTNHWTPNPPGVWGQDNNLYTKKPPGISFIVAPLLKLGTGMVGLNLIHLGLLTNSMVTALTASLLFTWLLDLGFSTKTALTGAFGYGLGTVAWVYARMFWESSLLALCFLAAVWTAYRAVYRANSSRHWMWVLLCGLAVGCGLSLRFEAILATFLVGVFLGWNLATQEARVSFIERSRRLGVALLIYLTPSILIGLGLLYFNLIRFGALAETGYSQELLFKAPWVGSFGLLFSPGRGLFIYAPLMLLLFWGIRPAWRRLPSAYFWLMMSLSLCYWLFYGSWFAWGGTWGWGPRFLLPILPLLMVFVVEPIELWGRLGPGPGYYLRFGGIVLLAILSILVNLLGIAVDFNEHFLRLGSNENFVFNWAVFPPLAHWQILQEGFDDLVWLRYQENSWSIDWSILWPSLSLVGLTLAYIWWLYRGQVGVNSAKKEAVWRSYLPAGMLGVLTVVLTLLTLLNTARVAAADGQAQADAATLARLANVAQPGDVLLVPMPPFGDAQEISTRLMAQLAPAMPAYAWIESEPRAIKPFERDKIWRAVQTEANRVWLFERWLTQNSATTPSAAYLNQTAFPLWEGWYPHSGKLSLYVLSDKIKPELNIPLHIPFEGGLTLVNSDIMATSLQPGEVLKVRLTWQAGEVAQVAGQHRVIAFAQIVSKDGQQALAQHDRGLIDLQNFNQSPLLPGQTVQQGYGLQMPDQIAPGDYPLIVGLYEASTGQRLLRADGSPDDFLYLTTIQITQPH